MKNDGYFAPSAGEPAPAAPLSDADLAEAQRLQEIEVTSGGVFGQAADVTERETQLLAALQEAMLDNRRHTLKVWLALALGALGTVLSVVDLIW